MQSFFDPRHRNSTLNGWSQTEFENNYVSLTVCPWYRENPTANSPGLPRPFIASVLNAGRSGGSWSCGVSARHAVSLRLVARRSGGVARRSIGWRGLDERGRGRRRHFLLCQRQENVGGIKKGGGQKQADRRKARHYG